MFVLVKNFTINGPDDTVVSTIKTFFLNKLKKIQDSLWRTHIVFSFKIEQTQLQSREDESLPESISTTGSNPLRIFMAPRYTEYTILTMLGDDREVHIFRVTQKF